MSQSNSVDQYRTEPLQLISPGLSVPPAVSPGARGLAELQRALGLGAELAAEVNRQAEKDRQNKEHLSWQLKGYGSRSAREMAPEVERAVADGTLSAPAGHERDVAEAWVQQATDGLSAPQIEGYRNEMLPKLERLLIQRNQRERIAARQDIVDATGDFVVGAHTADDVRSAVDDLAKKFPELHERDILGSTVIPALKSAARAGDQQRFENYVKVLDGQFAGDVEDQRGILQDAMRQQKQQGEVAALQGFYAGVERGDPYDVLRSRLDSLDAVDPQTRVGLGRMLLTRAQSRVEDDLRTRILGGSMTADEVQSEVLRRAKLGADNPGFLDPATGQALVGQAKDQSRFNLERVQVASVIGGGEGNLSELQHGRAFSTMVGPEGLGLIDGTNRIADPQALGGAILRGRIIPGTVRETLFASLTSPNAADVHAAATVVGMIGSSSPRLFARLYDAAPDSIRPALDSAVESFDRGRLQDASTQDNSIANIRQALVAKTNAPAVGADTLVDLKRNGIKDLDSHIDDVLTKSARAMPYGTDSGLFGLDFLWPDPSFTTAGANVLDSARHWFADRYARIRDRVPPQRAVQLADEYTRAKIRDSVDFVRWNGRLSPVLIDDGQGLRLPDSLRWSGDFEKEAKADLKSAGFDPANVVAMRPYLDPSIEPGTDPTSQMGWVFIDGEGDPIVNDSGSLLIFRPGDDSAQQSAKFQRMLDKKAQEFDHRRATERVSAGARLDQFYKSNPDAFFGPFANPAHYAGGGH